MGVVLNPIDGKFDVINNKASKIKVIDAGGYYTGTEVETALQEIGSGTAFDSRYVNVTGDTMTGQLLVDLGSDTTGIRVQANASQTANLQTWESSAGAVLSGVDERGVLFCHGGIDVAYNVLFGQDAGNVASSGTYNLAIGSSALSSVTTGSANTAIGKFALKICTEGYQNTALGSDTLRYLVTGFSNVAIGASALINTTGSENVGIGILAGGGNTTGSTNLAIASYSLLRNQTGSYNVAVGYCALRGEGGTAISHNVGIGQNAGYYVKSDYNIFIGSESGKGSASTTAAATYNVGIGYQSLYSIQTGSGNFALGVANLKFCTSGNDNISIGNTALALGVTVSNNVAIGKSALYNTTSNYNVAIGYQSLITNVTGTALLAIGYDSGQYNLGSYNIYMGYESGKGSASTTAAAADNVGIGYQALYAITTGSGNLVIGKGSGIKIDSGSYNVLIGRGAGIGITSGESNFGLGKNSLQKVSTQSNNVAIGSDCADGAGHTAITAIGNNSLRGATALTGSIAIGNAAGAASTGNYDLFIGYRAGLKKTSGGNNIFLGAFAGSEHTTGTQLFIVDSVSSARASAAVERTNSLLYGQMGAAPTSQTLRINADLTTSGGRTRNTTTVNAATYDITVNDDIIHVTYTGTGAVTSLTLPTAQCVDGRTIVIKDAGGMAATNNITIDTEGAETIDGGATYVINNDYESVTIYSDSLNWYII